MTVRIRPAEHADAAALEDLKWAWAAERGQLSLPRHEHRRRMLTWIAERRATHLPFLAVDVDRPVGMAFLAVVERVPGPAAEDRHAGDVQSVYVLPEHRGDGTGTALLTALVAEARARSLEFLTVRPSPRSVPFYQRLGFTGTFTGRGAILHLPL